MEECILSTTRIEQPSGKIQEHRGKDLSCVKTQVLVMVCLL